MALFSFIKSKGRRMITIWSYFCLACAFWGLGCYIISMTKMESHAYFGWQIAYLGAIFLPVLYYHFVNEYLQLKKRYILLVAYWFSFYFLICALFFKKSFFGDMRYVFNEFYCFYWNNNKDLVFLLFYVLFHWCLLAMSFFMLLSEYKSSIGLRRNQLQYILIASILGFLGGHLFFLVAFGVDIYPYANYLIAVYPLIMGYGIIRHRVLNIRTAITRTGIFVVVYSFVLGGPFALAFKYREQLIFYLGDNWWLAPLILMTILATIGPFIYLYINNKAEEKLLKEQRGYQQILRNASSGMIRIKDLRRLLNLVVHVVTKTVKISNAAIYLFDSETDSFKLFALRGRIDKSIFSTQIELHSILVSSLMAKNDPILVEEVAMRLREEQHNREILDLSKELSKLCAALVVPSFIDSKLTGIMVLGDKIARNLYTEDDIVVFSVLANQAALAIENAQFYDEVKRTHEQLFQAEKMATIGTMADGLSHQINNRFHALSLISGDALDILKTFDSSKYDGEVKQVLADLKGSLQRIEANVVQGGEVVKGLLKYSRPGDGGFESIEFKDVLNGSIDMVQYKIKLKEIDLIKDIPADLPKLHCNLTQLQEVFFNLIDNAYDATKERQATLKEEGYKSRIEITAKNADGSLEIVVSDNGMGVKDLDRKKLFTPFFTTKASAKKGTGLGLYVIDKIIASHNGHISIDSEYQSGTRFTITLPISPKAV